MVGARRDVTEPKPKRTTGAGARETGKRYPVNLHVPVTQERYDGYLAEAIDRSVSLSTVVREVLDRGDDALELLAAYPE